MRGSTLCTCADGSYGKCGAQCINTHGSFSCSCANGYRLLGKTKCVGMLVAQFKTLLTVSYTGFPMVWARSSEKRERGGDGNQRKARVGCDGKERDETALLVYQATTNIFSSHDLSFEQSQDSCFTCLYISVTKHGSTLGWKRAHPVHLLSLKQILISCIKVPIT